MTPDIDMDRYAILNANALSGLSSPYLGSSLRPAQVYRYGLADDGIPLSQRAKHREGRQWVRNPAMVESPDWRAYRRRMVALRAEADLCAKGIGRAVGHGDLAREMEWRARLANNRNRAAALKATRPAHYIPAKRAKGSVA